MCASSWTLAIVVSLKSDGMTVFLNAVGARLVLCRDARWVDYRTRQAVTPLSMHNSPRQRRHLTRGHHVAAMRPNRGG